MSLSNSPSPEATHHSTSTQLPQTLTDNQPLPRLIVFDLDYTLWPFWVDTHVTPPLRPQKPRNPNTTNDNTVINTAMLDRHNSRFAFYTDVPAILAGAKSRGVSLGVASRTHAPKLAFEMLRGLDVESPSSPPQGEEGKAEAAAPTVKPSLSLFAPELVQIYPGSKVGHFGRIRRESAKLGTGSGAGTGTIDYADMLFFDDEGRNRDVERELGVCFWLVPDGVDRDEFDRGVREWRRRRGLGEAGMGMGVGGKKKGKKGKGRGKVDEE